MLIASFISHFAMDVFIVMNTFAVNVLITMNTFG